MRQTIFRRRQKRQVWLAVSDDPAARVSGEYFYHMQRSAPNPAERDERLQDRLPAESERCSGIKLPL